MDSSLSMSRTGAAGASVAKERDPLSMVAMVARKRATPPQMTIAELEQRDEQDLNDR